MRRSFQTSHALHLPRFFDAELLQFVRTSLRRSDFADREDEGLAKERCMVLNPLLAMLMLVMNDVRLVDVIRYLTGCRPVGSFTGRIYMMHAAEHYDGWHSDVDGARLIGISVNLTDGAFAGGRFEMRRTNGNEIEWGIANTGPGDAILFQISHELQHRVTEVAGAVPRVAFAGWFQAEPCFLDVLKRGSESAAGHEVY